MTLRRSGKQTNCGYHRHSVDATSVVRRCNLHQHPWFVVRVSKIAQAGEYFNNFCSSNCQFRLFDWKLGWHIETRAPWMTTLIAQRALLENETNRLLHASQR